MKPSVEALEVNFAVPIKTVRVVPHFYLRAKSTRLYSAYTERLSSDKKIEQM
jgi:hypothetical protein